MSIGERFQKETKYIRGKIPGGFYIPQKAPELYKRYPGAKIVELAPMESPEGFSLWDAIARRRSEREYSRRPMSASELSTLLWASQGITEKIGGYELRSAPSAGALYPIETYVSVQNVSGIEPGGYHHAVKENILEAVSPGILSSPLARASLDQAMVRDAAAVFIWTAIFSRSRQKYGERAHRYVYLDCAHIAENLLLAVAALGLSACPIAAFYDDEVNVILGVDGEEESVLYMASVGSPT